MPDDSASQTADPQSGWKRQSSYEILSSEIRTADSRTVRFQLGQQEGRRSFLMNIEIDDMLFRGLKETLAAVPLKPAVQRKRTDAQFPMVTFTESDNILLSKLMNSAQTYSQIKFEVNIYAQDLQTEDGMRPALETARQLQQAADAYLTAMNLRRISAKRIPAAPDQEQITMEYTARVDDYRGQIC